MRCDQHGRIVAQLRAQIVPWSTLCRADWVRNDPVLTTRGWLLRQLRPSFSGSCARPGEHQGISLMRLGKWASGGDCESTSPRSLDELAQLRTHTAHYSPVMIAPLLINSSQRSCRPERSFFSGSRHDCGLCGPQSRRGRAGEELDLAYDRTNSVG